MSVGTFDSIYFREHALRERWNRQTSFFPNAREAGSCFVDGNSVLRNGTATASSFTALPACANAFIGVSAAAGGILGVPVGLSIARDGYKGVKAAVQCRDLEGVFHKGLWGSVGANFAGLSGILAAEGIMSLQGSAIPAAIAPAFAGLGFGLYGSLLGYGAYGYWRAAEFQKELKMVVRNEGDWEALQFLSRQIDLTESELNEVRRSKNPGREKARLLQKKWNRFELRTNARCASVVRERLPALMQNFDPVQVRELLVEVEKAAFQSKVKHILLIVLAILGIGASIFVIVAMGPASPLLFAVGALIWFTVDSSGLNNCIAETCWAWRQKKDQLLLDSHVGG